MAFGHTARMDVSASPAGRVTGRAVARGGAAGFASALDATGGADAARKAAPRSAPPAGDKAADRDVRSEPAASARAAEVPRDARPGAGKDATKAAGRPATARGLEGRAGADKAAGTVAQDGESPTNGDGEAAPVEGQARPATQPGMAPDEGTVAQLAGLVLDEAGAEDEAPSEGEMASEAAPGAVPVLPILTVLVSPRPISAAVTGLSAASGQIQGGGSTLPGIPGGPNSGTAGAPAAIEAQAAPTAQARATALLLGEGRAERGERATESAPVASAPAGTAEAKPDFLAALGDAAPGLAPPAESPKTGHLQAPAAQQAAPAQAQGPAVPIGQVPMTIGLRSLAGSSQFEIRLDPVDLGRIDVTLEIDKERGTVMTHLVVERIDTLAMLQRDAGSLQQALSQAGLDASGEDGIRLSLRGDGTAQDQSQARGDGGGQDGRGRRGGWTAETPEAAEIAPLRMLRGLGSLDIRI